MDNRHDDEHEYYMIKITRRPWYEWVLWGLWVFLELFFLQAALASREELEPRAAIIFWMVFGVLLLGGAIVWIIRRGRLL